MTASSAPRERVRLVSPPDAGWLGAAGLGLLLLAAGLLLMYAGRHLTFFYDEWTFAITRRGGGVGTYLDPHNGHLSLFPVLVYKALYATVGLRHYFPYRLVLTLLHVLCGALLYVLARRRVGPVWALVPACLLLFLGSAWQDLLWPFQIGYLGSVAGGFGAFALLDRPGRRGHGWAALLLGVSLASSSAGISFLLAAAALLLLQRRPWRELWIVGLPAALYILWYIGWGGGEQTSADAILGAPQYVANAGGGAVAGIVGLDPGTWGGPLLVALLATLVMRAREAAPTRAAIAAWVGVLVFWVLTAVVRSGVGEPAASRYVYIGAAFILLAVVESAAGAVGATGGRLTWLGLALSGLLLAGALLTNIDNLRRGERSLRASDDSVRASLAAVQIAAPAEPAGFVPDQVNAPQLTAGGYLQIVHDLGSPAPSEPALLRAAESFRARADIVLAHAEGIGGGGASAMPPSGLHVAALFGAVFSRHGSCGSVTPTAPLASVDLSAAVGTALSVHQPAGGSATIYLRRFASAFGLPALTTVPAGRTTTLAFPRDLAPQVSWAVQVVDTGPFSVCGAAGAR